MSICKNGRCEVMLHENNGVYCEIHQKPKETARVDTTEFKEKTLLEKAKEFKPRVQRTNKISQEHIDLLIAYLKGEIQQSAVAYSIFGNAKNTSVYSFLMKIVLEDIEQGRLIIK